MGEFVVPSFSCLGLSYSGAVWTLTVQRPEALNAMNSVVLGEIEQCVHFYVNCRLVFCVCWW